MTEVQENNSRSRWPFGRRDAGSGDAAETTGTTGTSTGTTPRGRWFGPRPGSTTGADTSDTSGSADTTGSTTAHTTEDTDRKADRTDPLPDAPTRGTPDPDDHPTAVVAADPDLGRRRRVADRARLRERFGGRKVGAAFFGWLVAVGMTVLLSTLATALGVAIGTSMGLDPSGADAAPIGLTGGAVLLGVLGVSYLAGGYVAGRLARFDGTSNGLLCWLFGLLVTGLAIIAGAVVGTARTDLLERLQLPSMPGDLSTLGVAGIVALVAVLLVTAATAALGGRLGERYHRRVDRAAERL